MQARSFQVWFHCVSAGNSLPLAAGYRRGDIVGFFQLLSLIHLSFRHVTSFSSSFLNYPVISISSKQPHMVPSTFLYRLDFCFMSLTVSIDWGRQARHQRLPSLFRITNEASWRPSVPGRHENIGLHLMTGTLLRKGDAAYSFARGQHVRHKQNVFICIMPQLSKALFNLFPTWVCVVLNMHGSV